MVTIRMASLFCRIATVLNSFTLRLSKIPRACIHMMSDSKTFKTKRSKMLLSPWLVDASCNPFENLTNYLPLGDFLQRTRQTCDIQLSFQCSEGKLLRTNQSKIKRKRKTSEHLGQKCLFKFHVVLSSEFCKAAVIYANDTHSTNSQSTHGFNLWAFLQSTCRILTVRWISTV